jgi:hypothetical protein
MKRFEDFKNEIMNEAAAPFYSTAEKIKSIISSDTVASKMGMQSIDSVTQKSDLVYSIKSNSVSGYYFKVTLNETPGGNYGEGKKYSVAKVEKLTV